MVNSYFQNKESHELYNLARNYSNGNGVKQDHREAVRLYKLAASKGHIEAQRSLNYI